MSDSGCWSLAFDLWSLFDIVYTDTMREDRTPVVSAGGGSIFLGLLRAPTKLHGGRQGRYHCRNLERFRECMARQGAMHGPRKHHEPTALWPVRCSPVGSEFIR